MMVNVTYIECKYGQSFKHKHQILKELFDAISALWNLWASQWYDCSAYIVWATTLQTPQYKTKVWVEGNLLRVLKW